LTLLLAVGLIGGIVSARDSAGKLACVKGGAWVQVARPGSR